MRPTRPLFNPRPEGRCGGFRWQLGDGTSKDVHMLGAVHSFTVWEFLLQGSKGAICPFSIPWLDLAFRNLLVLVDIGSRCEEPVYVPLGVRVPLDFEVVPPHWARWWGNPANLGKSVAAIATLHRPEWGVLTNSDRKCAVTTSIRD